MVDAPSPARLLLAELLSLARWSSMLASVALTKAAVLATIMGEPDAIPGGLALDACCLLAVGAAVGWAVLGWAAAEMRPAGAPALLSRAAFVGVVLASLVGGWPSVTDAHDEATPLLGQIAK